MGLVLDERRILRGPPRDRALFSRLGYSRGDVIARCPVIPLDRRDTRIIRRTAWGSYLFRLRDDTALFALEYGSLCLGQGLPKRYYNARAIYDQDKWGGRGALEVVCSQSIAPNTRVLCSPFVFIRPGHIRGRIFNERTEIKKSPGKGLGVFARRAFRPRQLIEKVPNILAPSRDSAAITDTVLVEHLRGGFGGVNLMPLGLWGFHNTTPTCDNTNAGEGDCTERRLTWTYCRKPIAKGDEVLIPYVKGSMEGIKMV